MFPTSRNWRKKIFQRFQKKRRAGMRIFKKAKIKTKNASLTLVFLYRAIYYVFYYES